MHCLPTFWLFAARLQIDNSNGFFDQMQDSDRDALGALTVCTTDIEPSDKHDDKRIRIDVASASSEKEQKGQVLLPGLSLDSLIVHFFSALTSKTSSQIYSIECHPLRIQSCCQQLGFRIYTVPYLE
jgi:hypothetical protein